MALRVIGPTTAMSVGRRAPSRWPREGTSSRLGLWPKTPQKCDGLRIEPPMSLPSSSAVRPAASGTLVLPKITAPADSSLDTATASRSGRLARCAGKPQVLGVPTRSFDSLSVTGTPCSGTQLMPPAIASSAWAARARAASRSCRTIALIDGLMRSTRSKKRSSSSTAPIRPWRISRARSAAEANHGSFNGISGSGVNPETMSPPRAGIHQGFPGHGRHRGRARCSPATGSAQGRGRSGHFAWMRLM